ncbi:hypothetical protein Q5H92_13230 [Hymenobacter sp. M29]|uniref:Uncharacterized protein n=1 Tax=Hymenobacter mellowenesis TaxID=3063995 RepID=A0ABT9ABX2_9BACT|nr:hypothetical protein [Hymenobacter sp. M29]MDO7847329.1 hypothetical protein [Hymenobacter sp. M29]
MSDFWFNEDNDKIVITHLPSKFNFQIDVHSEKKPTDFKEKHYLRLTFSPDFLGPIIQQDTRVTLSGLDNWNEINLFFSNWIHWFQKEYSAPDLWAEAAKTAQLFASTTEQSDDKFTRTELAEVQGQLRLLQLSFSQSALPEAAKQKLIELTETAAVKAEGLTKKDWQNWIIGGFISAITSLTLNPTQAGEVLKLVKVAFGGLFLH